MHAVDRLARMHMLMQRLQHQSVAAERHQDIGVDGVAIAIEYCQLRKRLLGLHAGARDEGDPFISLRRGHGIASSYRCKSGSGCAGVVYTTLAGLVEVTEGYVQAAKAIGRPLEATARYNFQIDVRSDRLSRNQYLATTAPGPLNR